MVRSLPKAPRVLQTLLLIFSWCSHNFSSSPLSPFLPTCPFQSPSAFALILFLQRVRLQRAWVIHHGTWVNGFWLPFWGHNGPAVRNWPLTQNDTKPQVHLTGHQKRCAQWVWFKKGGQMSQPDRHKQWVHRFGEHMIQTHCCFKHFPLLCSVIDCILKGTFVYSFLTEIFPSWRMSWQWYEVNWKNHLTFSKLYIPQTEKLSI